MPLPSKMGNSSARLATRLVYGARQLPRVAWYVGHSLLLQRLTEIAREQEAEEDGGRAPAKSPNRRRLYADMALLFQQDLTNVEAGIYPMPEDHDGAWPALLRRSRMFFEDLPAIHRRRQTGAVRQVLDERTRGKRPSYYLQNFHFQWGGWMTEESAQRYDTQIEVLFNGTANATRRQALLPLHEVFTGRSRSLSSPARA